MRLGASFQQLAWISSMMSLLPNALNPFVILFFSYDFFLFLQCASQCLRVLQIASELSRVILSHPESSRVVLSGLETF